MPPALAEQLALARRNALDIAARYRDAGFAVVIDDVLDPNLLDEYRLIEGVLDVVRVCLSPPVDVVLARNAGRGYPEHARVAIDAGVRLVCDLVQRYGAELEARGWTLLDSAAQTVDETAAAIAALHRRGES